MANARAILNKAFTDVGAKDIQDTLGPAEAEDGLSRLNAMVSSWRTQDLTVLAVERQVFNLTANKQTYSIGLGAEFNVPRPQQVNGAGLWLNALSSTTSVTITRSGTTATVAWTSHGVAVGESVFIAGCTNPAYNGLQAVLTVPTANSFTYQVFGSPVSPAAGSPTAQTLDGVPVEIPRAMLTDDAYQAVQLKTLTNAQFTNVYYNATQPYGTIWLWPIPSTDENALVLYLQNQFTGFADLNTDYTFTDVPGYEEALEYNLARRLLGTPYAVKDAQLQAHILDMASTSLGLIKRQNYKLSDLPVDPALTANIRGGYNINTGTGG